MPRPPAGRALPSSQPCNATSPCLSTAYHNASQTQPERAELRHVGLDLVEGIVRDNRQHGVLEPALSKVKQLKFATEAAITILRIDDCIKLEPEQADERSYQNAMRRGQLG